MVSLWKHQRISHGRQCVSDGPPGAPIHCYTGHAVARVFVHCERQLAADKVTCCSHSDRPCPLARQSLTLNANVHYPLSLIQAFKQGAMQIEPEQSRPDNPITLSEWPSGWKPVDARITCILLVSTQRSPDDNINVTCLATTKWTTLFPNYQKYMKKRKLGFPMIPMTLLKLKRSYIVFNLVLQKYRSTDSCCKSLYSYVHDGLFKKRILLFIHVS